MKFRKLGLTDLEVSEICLGTMTWGEQNTEQEAFEQLDYAVGEGVNFIDTAEMYPVPPRAKTYSLTEQYIGNWLKKRGKRDDLIIATKVFGKGMDYGRPDEPMSDLTAKQIKFAIEGSLQRLGTDYIDLYQLHWPSRTVNLFGERFFPLHAEKSNGVPIEESLETLHDLVEVGKIRHVGLSNETPWGTMQFINVAKANGWPRPVSVQNAYSLLNCTYEYAMSEVSLREDIGLLAYSPLASGLLSGKYLDGQFPPKARMTLFREFARRYKDGDECTRVLSDLAKVNNMDPCQMALAYTLYGNFVTSTIIGATTMEQLKTNIASVDVNLDGIIEEINQIKNEFRSPGC